MSPTVLGLLFGSGFGLFAVASMIPLQFADKTSAMLAAFASRFAIGFLIPHVHLPMPMVATGALVGLMISLPDAIVTKAYVPILGLGIAGGAVIGWLTQRFAA